MITLQDVTMANQQETKNETLNTFIDEDPQRLYVKTIYMVKYSPIMYESTYVLDIS